MKSSGTGRWTWCWWACLGLIQGAVLAGCGSDKEATPGGGAGDGSAASSGSPSSGASSGGTTVGGAPSGGMPSGGASGGNDTGGRAGSMNDGGGGSSQGDAGADAGGSSGAADSAGSAGTGGDGGTAGMGAVPVGLTKDGETRVTAAGLTIVSYGGYLNGESFQQDGIVSHDGYQYAAFWNTARHVVLARRALPSGAWSTIEFTDYTNSANDAHNTISIGISPGDGTLHLAFDHHDNDLHYRKSIAGLLSTPSTGSWAASSFSAVTSALVGTTTLTQVTYPRFVIVPGGNQLLFGARIGASGAGDEHLWEYDTASHSWRSVGKYIDGISDSVNAYLHGLAYTRGGNRLHAAWCWRETPEATTNHDLFYIYSDDNGRNWRDNAGAIVAVAGSRFVTKDTASAKVWTIAQNRGLINQEHLTVDSSGVVHVLLSHMPDAQANDSNFTNARTKSQFFHYWRGTNGTWNRAALGLPVIENFRGKLAVSSSRNVYAILPNLRVAGASLASDYKDWALLDDDDAGRFFSDPLIDAARLERENKLTIYYPQEGSPNIYALDYTIR